MPIIHSDAFANHVARRVAALNIAGEGRLAALLESTAFDTLRRAVVRAPGHDGEPLDGETEIITGDIPAMWLRDAVAQVEPLWAVAGKCPEVQRLLTGLVRRLSRGMAQTPYANALKVRCDGPARERLLGMGVPEEWLDGATPHAGDVLPEGIARDGAWEMKWEVDSAAWYVRLVRRWVQMRTAGFLRAQGTQRDFIRRLERFHAKFEEEVSPGLRACLRVLALEMAGDNPERPLPKYGFERPGGGPLDQGPDPDFEFKESYGMVRSAFRPSDDRCALAYPVAANAMLGRELVMLAEALMMQTVGEICESEGRHPMDIVPWASYEMAYLDSTSPTLLAMYGGALGKDLEKGAWMREMLDFQDWYCEGPEPSWPRFGVLAYETDGDDKFLHCDDANVPGLHSLGWLGFAEFSGRDFYDDAVGHTRRESRDARMRSLLGMPLDGFGSNFFVSRTREFVYSAANPQFVPLTAEQTGGAKVPGGLGSEHTGPGRLWPMSLAVAALSEPTKARRVEWLRALAAMCPDGQVHESVDPANPADYTREWFGMGNALAALAILGAG